MVMVLQTKDNLLKLGTWLESGDYQLSTSVKITDMLWELLVPELLITLNTILEEIKFPD